MDIAHLIFVIALTMAVICQLENAIWTASCFLMGAQIGNAIINIKQP